MNKDVRKQLQALVGDQFKVQTKYEQNSNLYGTMQLEKWAIYAVLTLILIIAAFNMVSSLTMLVLWKETGYCYTQSMGTTRSQVKKYFCRKAFYWQRSVQLQACCLSRDLHTAGKIQIDQIAWEELFWSIISRLNW